MKVIIIVAIAQNNAIGKDNNLLWHLPADMKFFKEQTSGQTIITGRKNYESIPEKFRPLPNRTNIVVTRDKNFQALGATVVYNLEDAIEKSKSSGAEKCFIIGGGQIYKESLEKNLVDEMLITHVEVVPKADTFFPEVDSSKWQKELITELNADEKNKFSMKIYRYLKK
jgi:dihydrofolate reductase